MAYTIRSKFPAARAGPAVILGLLLVAGLAPGKADSSGVRWEKRIEVASGGAFRGPWRMNASEFHYVDDPAVAINEEGMIAVAWADQSRQDIFLQVFAPGGKERFEKPVNISRSPNVFSWLPRMVLTSSGQNRIYILWQEIVFSGGTHGGEIFFARSTDGGNTFSPPMNLSKTIAGAGKGRLTRDYWHNGSLDIAAGPRGELYAAWTEYEGALRFSRSTDGGVNFSEPQRIWNGGDANPARAPSLAAGAEGDVHLAWTIGEEKSADIHFASSDDQGRSFGDPRIVDRSEGHADAPKIAVDAKGTLHLVYAESPDGPLRRYHIHYTQLRDGEDAFEKPRKIAAPDKEWESMNFPGIGLGGKDDLYVIWELFPRPVSYPEGLGYTFSKDGGQTFAPPAEIPGSVDPAAGTSGGRQGLLMRKLAVNADGAIAVAHSTFRESKNSRIWLFRGRSGR